MAGRPPSIYADLRALTNTVTLLYPDEMTALDEPRASRADAFSANSRVVKIDHCGSDARASVGCLFRGAVRFAAPGSEADHASGTLRVVRAISRPS